MCTGVVILVDSVQLEAVLLKHDSILNPSCGNSEVTPPVTIVDYRLSSYATSPYPQPVYLILCVRKVAVHLDYGTVGFQSCIYARGQPSHPLLYVPRDFPNALYYI
jgi:hypothetical protein